MESKCDYIVNTKEEDNILALVLNLQTIQKVIDDFDDFMS